MLRLLRSEQSTMRSEAALIRWIRDSLSKQQQQQQQRPRQSPNQLRPSGGKPPHVSGSTRQGSTSVASVYDETSDFHSKLVDVVPDLASDSAISSGKGASCLLLGPTQGAPVDTLSTPLTTRESDCVDYKTGQLLRQISLLSSPSGHFGPVGAVLSSPESPKAPTGTGISQHAAAESWSTAFHSLLESILRDGEDMAVMLNYSAIRGHFRRLAYVLDEVKMPRLVILDAADGSNILVKRQRGDEGVGGKGRATDWKTVVMNPDSQQGPGKDAASLTSPADKDEVISVMGLRDWSNAIFGDPLMGTVFCSEASPEFLRGFNGETAPASDFTLPFSHNDLIDDWVHSHVRILLYQCYHAVVCIVREFYRPREQSSEHELAARKRLNEVLTKLEAVGTEPKRHHRRPSGEASLAKKTRQGDL